MPGLGIRDYEATGALVTPYRDTEVTFDLQEVVAVESPFSLRRFGRQIVPDPDSVTSQPRPDLELLASGYWSLRPIQEDLHRVHERTAIVGSVMLLSEFNAIAALKQEPLWRTPTEILGLTNGADPSLALSNNDLFFTFRRTSGTTWDSSIALSVPKVDYETENLLMDRVMDATAIEQEDRGFMFRFQTTGTHRHAPDNLITFYWGGPLSVNGYGQFALTFRGNGTCQLWEFVAGEWLSRKEWAYASPHQVMNSAHSMRIIPHCRQFCEFKAATNRQAAPIIWQQQRGNYAPYAAQGGAPTVELYTAERNPEGTFALHDRFMTGPGSVKVDVRRDLRIAWQITRLTYPGVGTLVDMPFVVPFGVGDEKPLRISPEGFSHKTIAPGPGGGDVTTLLTSIDTIVFNAATGLELPDHSGGVGWELPADENKTQVAFQFNSLDGLEGTRSPYLAGYTAWREGSQATITPGEKRGGSLVDCQITGPTNDPTHETATLVIEDLEDELEILRRRGTLSLRVDTTYDAAATLRSTLFHGRVIRPEARKGGPDIGQAYPDPEWRGYEIQAVGEWQRLAEQLMIGHLFFDQDTTAPLDINGRYPPWKITEVLKTVIRDCGYPLNQIDVPDRDLRMPTDQGTDALAPAPFTNRGDFVQRIARDYLGAFFVWDGNAINGGFRGMWRLLFGPRVNMGDSPLWKFTNDEPLAPAGGGVTLTFRSEAYPPITSPIRKGSFRTWVVPPEANAVVVTATGALLPDAARTNLVQWAINYRSYDPPGGPGLADPNHPDYIGRFVPLIVTDPWVSGGQSGAEGQALVDAVTRRLFNFACRAEKWAAWEAELALVQPGSDTLLDRKRPLRRGDFVLVDDEQFLIDCCDISYQKDGMQMASYEAIAWREDTL